MLRDALKPRARQQLRRHLTEYEVVLRQLCISDLFVHSVTGIYVGFDEEPTTEKLIFDLSSNETNMLNV